MRNSYTSQSARSKPTTFIDVRKEMFERDIQKMQRYQSSFKKSFEEIHSTQAIQDYLMQKVPIHQKNDLQTSYLQKRSNDPTAITINAIQFINNSSLANTRASKTQRYEGSDKFFDMYIRTAQKSSSSHRDKKDTVQYQTLNHGSQLSIHSTIVGQTQKRHKGFAKQADNNYLSARSLQGSANSSRLAAQNCMTDWNGGVPADLYGTYQDQQRNDRKIAEFQQQPYSNQSKELKKIQEGHILYSSVKSFSLNKKRNVPDTANLIPNFKSEENQNYLEDMVLSIETQNRLKRAAKEIVQKEMELDSLNLPKNEESFVDYQKINLENEEQQQMKKESNIKIQDQLLSSGYNSAQESKSKFELLKNPSECESKGLWNSIQKSQKQMSEKPVFNLDLTSQNVSKQRWVRSINQAEYQTKLNTILITKYQKKIESKEKSEFVPSIFIDQGAKLGYKKGREILIIEIYNLQNVKTHLNLKYCFLNLPHISPKTLEANEKIDFIKFKSRVLKNLRITAHDIFLYQKNGKPVYSHKEISQHTQTLFASNSRTFSGIDNMYCAENSLNSLKQVIQKLEFKLTDASKPRSEQSSPLSKIPILESQKSSQFAFTQSASLFRNASIQNQKSFASIEQKNIKKSQYRDELGNLSPERERTSKNKDRNLSPQQFLQVNSYLRDVMKYLDLFFSKFDYNWRTEKEKDEVDLYMKQQLAQPKHMKKHMVLDFKLKAFERRKIKVDGLKKLNREIFVSKIGTVLQQHQLNESDLNSVYLLYRSILNISSMIISLEEIVKEDDYFVVTQNIETITEENKEFIISLCDYENIINWPNFVDLLKSISSKDEEDQISMFVEVFDSDNSGTLSFSEIQYLANLTLEYIIDGKKNKNLLSELVKYFSFLLFSSLREEGQTEIPMDKIKKAIREKKENCDLLCFFCGTSYQII